MKKIYIWGVGASLKDVEQAINWNCAELIGYLDNDELKQDTILNGKKILAISKMEKECDYVIVSLYKYYEDVKKQLIDYGIDEKKILVYYDSFDMNFTHDVDFVNLCLRMEHIFKYKYWGSVTNLEYEIADKLKNNYYRFPLIKSAEEGLLEVIEKKKSLSRFGDGELEIICGRNKCPYQKSTEKLSRRLLEVLNNSNENIVTGLSVFLGSLECFKEQYAEELRRYLTKDKRKDYQEIIDYDKVYYDALMSRPYMMRQDRGYAEKIFRLWKKIWDRRDIVIVEGEGTRSGVGNDLYDHAASIKRILCPSKNAWDKYDSIFEYVCNNVKKTDLVMILLGPAATVMAYDLALKGYQAIDTGHLDVEYEWYLMKASGRMDIRNKFVAEMGKEGEKYQQIDDDIYLSQIMTKII